MGEQITDVNKKIDDVDANVKRYASKDTVISIGGYEFTPAKLMIAFTLVSTTLGGLYGTFEVYKDYQNMKKKIAEYVTPDLTDIQQRLAVIQENSEKAVQYTQDIKNDLKQDIRRLESIVDAVERTSKQSQRETSAELKNIQRDVGETIRTTEKTVNETAKSAERAIQSAERSIQQVTRDLDRETRTMRREIDEKIRKALDNPLAR